VTPLFAVLLVLILQLGMALNYKNQTARLASEGARLAAVDKNPGALSLQEYIKDGAVGTEIRDGGTDAVPTPLTVCIEQPSGDALGSPVRVTTELDYDWFPILGSDLPIVGNLGLVAAVPIRGSSVMRIEKTDPVNYSPGCTA